jgi:two-component sensor histidine kinase
MVFHDSTIEHHVVKQIEATLLEKEILLKEIHHRVKNNLQIIASLLDLQSENIQDRTLIKIFENSRHRIRSMALLHEELYQSTETTTISMAPYFNSLVSYLYYAYGINTAKIALQFDVAPISLILDQAIPCGLIVNELVTNSLKHAFPAGRSGSILVRFQLIDNDQYQLTVADDGIGLMGDFDLQQADSFGLQLVALLTRQLEGTYEIDQTDRTAFTITFPRA